MATHSSVLAWRIPWTEKPTVHGVAQSQTRLKQLSSSSSSMQPFISHHFSTFIKHSKQAKLHCTSHIIAHHNSFACHCVLSRVFLENLWWSFKTQWSHQLLKALFDILLFISFLSAEQTPSSLYMAYTQIIPPFCICLLAHLSFPTLPPHLLHVKLEASVRQRFFKYFYLLIYGCPGSSLLHGLFSSCRAWGLFCSCIARASHAGGFSCRRARSLGCTDFNSRGSQALKHRLRSCGSQTLLLQGMWDLPGSGIELKSPALAGGFFSTELSGKPSPLCLDSCLGPWILR